MWRYLCGVFFVVASLYFAVREWHPINQNVLAAQADQTSILASYPATPGLPDPNDIFDEINQIRQSGGLSAMVRNDKLTEVAQKRANDMSAYGYYAHRSPSGLYFYDMFEEYHYVAGFSCENLDLEFSKLTEIYVNAWMNSTAGHRECLLNPKVSEAGYATAQITTSTPTNKDVTSYLVVAIYAEAPDSN